MTVLVKVDVGNVLLCTCTLRVRLCGGGSSSLFSSLLISSSLISSHYLVMEKSKSSTSMERVSRILSLLHLSPELASSSSLQPHSLLKQQASSLSPPLFQEKDNAEVSEWLSVSHGLCGPEKKTPFLALLEEHLGRHSFLLSSSSGHSLADVAVFDAIQQPKVASEAVKYKNVCRWARLMGECLNVSLEMKISQQPTVFPLLEASGVSSSSSSSEKKEAEKKEVPQMSEKQIAKQKEKAAKKEKAAAATNKKEETKAGSDEMDPSKLDFRVGLVKKCWPHPEAEKLLW